MNSDIRQELSELLTLQGNDFVRLLRQIAARKEFRPLASDPNIYIVGGEGDADFPRLLDAARKAVAQGYRVYMLPNPTAYARPISYSSAKACSGCMTLKRSQGKVPLIRS